MKKIISLIISLTLVFTLFFSAVACSGNGGEGTSSTDNNSGESGNGGSSGGSSGGEDTPSGSGSGSIVIVDPTDYDYSGGSKHDENYYKVSVPDYKKTNDLLISEGATEYQIVVAEGASATVYNAASELNTLVYAATGAVFGIKTDAEVSWSDSAKFISLGDNNVSNAAGCKKISVNSRGYTIKRIGKSLFLRGTTDDGTAFSVYGLLKEILDFECYSPDEYEIAKTKTLYLPDIDLTDEPDIEYIATHAGLINGNFSSRLKYRSASFMYPKGGAQWHNSFNYFPVKEYFESHPNWYAEDRENLCLTAHGDKTEYDLLVSTTVEKMKEVITDNPLSKVLTFTHQDVGTWCTCDACSAIKEKYGTNAATKIMFMNDVVSKVEEWRKEAYPDRDDIRYVFFAYTSTRVAPTKVENGKIVPIDEKVRPHEKIGVMYAPIESDFFHAKSEPQNSSQYSDMQNWKALVGDKIFYWFYQAYFYDYFIPYSNFESMQGDFKAMKENGGAWVYFQSKYDTRNASGFEVLKAYLESKLAWDVDSDVVKYTDEFFKFYFRDASDYMRAYYNGLRLNFLNMSENLGVGGWIGTRVLTVDYFKLNTLLEWNNLIEKSYAAIEDLKDSDPDLYKKVYDRIRLESLSVRYMLIQLYGTSFYTNAELLEQKLTFKKDCTELNVTYFREHQLIMNLWASWGI